MHVSILVKCDLIFNVYQLPFILYYRFKKYIRKIHSSKIYCTVLSGWKHSSPGEIIRLSGYLCCIHLGNNKSFFNYYEMIKHDQA